MRVIEILRTVPYSYENDIWRASQVRNSWVTKDGGANVFLDAASWESIRRRGDHAVMSWIDQQLSGTGVTVVLIGSETAERKYVRYEIHESHRRGNGLLGIYIHKMKDQHGERCYKGRNPFSRMTASVAEDYIFGLFSEVKRKRLSALYPTYDWVDDDGYRNISNWIEEAARQAGR